ncbi:hypothetical protein IVG45_05140 [Methylomonas sp. LL1]|uniref:hypothetical protein n=1 Tax=Methylomonas sp. LL1 TaxID=2785785 RepID=UPI0018C3603E|nr:hypothetical protein [Methylomonas sp. LL1]QPK64352.1 hypothetical protein IVG45_05140 [Methylomonas sp. LL1]
MMIKLALLAVALLVPLTATAEVLGHISEDTTPIPPSQPEGSQNHDRRIIYRVICSPEDQGLPDCERPFDDTESSARPVSRPEPDMPDDALQAETEQAIQPAKPLKATPATSKKSNSSKKSPKAASRKKSTKKSPAKKAANKKK